jgi:hypothetical protein
MLNPSMADEATDDPTIRRCIRFARTWAYGSLAVGNLFAYRSTSPAKLCAVSDPLGPDNEDWLRRLHGESSLTIAAWGNHCRLLGQSSALRRMLGGLHILGLTSLGEPRHPLYLRSDVMPFPWPAPIA